MFCNKHFFLLWYVCISQHQHYSVENSVLTYSCHCELCKLIRMIPAVEIQIASTVIFLWQSIWKSGSSYLFVCLNLSTLTKHRLRSSHSAATEKKIQFEPTQQTEVCLFSVIVTHCSSKPEWPSEAYVFV